MLLRSIKFLSFLFLCSGCLAHNHNNLNEICKNGKITCIYKKENILLITNRGEIHIELNGEVAPLTVGNFVDLVERGFYNNTYFHRVINKPFPFLVKAGDPSYKSKKLPINKNSGGGFIDMETGRIRYIPLEIKLNDDLKPRYGELITSTYNIPKIEMRHSRGSLSMSRMQNANSASSQFFIALRPLPELDGRYAVFGKITKGIDIINIINKDDYIIKAIRQ